MKPLINFAYLSPLLTLLFLPGLNAQVSDIQLYGFIHSLVVHDPPLIPVPNHETTTPYWINDIAQSASNTFAFTGQFGQLPSHVDQLPPDDNIGFPEIESPWDASTGQTFATSNINTVLLTAANFIQWDLPTNPDPADPSGRSIVENTETLFDWTENERPDLRYYIYANWPEMDNENAFPPTVPTESEIDQFHDITLGNTGTFNEWWIRYHDAIVASRPSLQPKLIPVGRIISQIHTEVIPGQIPFDELYEDSAPHGRASTYFLAGLITYTAIYEQRVPAIYMPSDIVHPAIRNNLAAINDLIIRELNDFNFPSGESRVFYSPILRNDNIEVPREFRLTPNPVKDVLTITLPSAEKFTAFIFDINGTLIKVHEDIDSGDSINVSAIKSGVYLVRLTNGQGVSITQKLVKY